MTEYIWETEWSQKEMDEKRKRLKEDKYIGDDWVDGPICELVLNVMIGLTKTLDEPVYEMEGAIEAIRRMGQQCERWEMYHDEEQYWINENYLKELLRRTKKIERSARRHRGRRFQPIYPVKPVRGLAKEAVPIGKMFKKRRRRR